MGCSGDSELFVRVGRTQATIRGMGIRKVQLGDEKESSQPRKVLKVGKGIKEGRSKRRQIGARGTKTRRSAHNGNTKVNLITKQKKARIEKKERAKGEVQGE